MNQLKFKNSLSLLAVVFTLFGCGADVLQAPQQSGCDANSAAIGVYDNFLQNLCGCNETAGTIAQAGTPLTCTLNSGTTVFFHYFSSSVPHQIISTDGAFVSSPLNNPKSATPIKSHGVVINAAGTFPFNDQVSPTMSGQIISL